MKKGFTLIELLVVVGIISILAIVVILTINPPALLQQSRDASRVAGLSTLNKATALYYQDAINNPATLFMGTSSVVYISIPDKTASSTAGDQCQGLNLPGLPTGYTYHCAASTTYMNPNGTGWVPINFTSYSGGNLIQSLPVDPVNASSSNLYYTYQTDGVGGFEYNCFLESQKEAAIPEGDGGNDPVLYEKGSNLTLPSARGLVGYWNFDEGSGSSTIDSSGNNNTGTWSGAPAGTSGYYSAGKVGPWAGMFSWATANSISIPITNTSTMPSSAMTVSAWVNVSANVNYSIFLQSNWANVGSWTLLGNTAGALFGVIGPGPTQHNAIYPLSPGTWHMLTGTYDGQNVKLYVDGTLESTNALSGQTLNQISPLVADFNASTAFTFEDDDVRLYNRALSATEIAEMYAAEH